MIIERYNSNSLEIVSHVYIPRVRETYLITNMQLNYEHFIIHSQLSYDPFIILSHKTFSCFGDYLIVSAIRKRIVHNQEKREVHTLD